MFVGGSEKGIEKKFNERVFKSQINKSLILSLSIPPIYISIIAKVLYRP